MNEIKLQDAYSRPLRDLRISVTDRCNFRCVYCMPSDIFGPDYSFMPREELLTFEEIVRLARLFVNRGVEKIRLTGGEPLLRKNFPVLVSMLSQIDGLKDLSVTTNGLLLRKFAPILKEAGVHRVNVSLDALDNEIFTKMNGVNVRSESVLSGIDAAKESGLTVKVNMVVKKGMNDTEILPMARVFREKGITLRFIEFMDVGATNGWKMDEVVTSKEIHAAIHREMPLEPVDPNYFGEVAKRYRYAGTDTEIGFISSVSAAFCSSCTRARLSADGRLYTCLFAGKGVPFRELVRSHAADDEILSVIDSTWNKRDDRYSELRSQFYESGKQKERIEMSYIGG
ncbi:GTP 3',8-cyclase MoaA [Ectobacillus panaciterrae]|uniref:GTP 3',8-cyclase MoaA n=1 Tax=Ectobacillus panaciterrae TaxID=363872 RepID=UPI0003FABEBC|nr:GTP 3',8-cyclase MoaA [Ectobacillus panaciterrae]